MTLLTGYFLVCSGDTELKFVTSCITVEELSHQLLVWKFSFVSKVIAFLFKLDFLHFSHIFAYKSRTTDYFQNWLIHIKVRLKTYQNHYSFYWKINFVLYEIDFLLQIDRFPHDFFFWKSGQSWLVMADSSSQSSNVNSLLKKHFLYPDLKVISQ